MRILKAMRRSLLGLDLYMWLSYRTLSLCSATGPKAQRLSCHQLYVQSGKDLASAADKGTVDYFRTDALLKLRKLKWCWPTLDYKTSKGGNQWYSGGRLILASMQRDGTVQSVVTTAANVADCRVLPDLLHGEERRVWGDRAYKGQTEPIKEAAPKAQYVMCNRTR